jgi:hypothetical protein
MTLVISDCDGGSWTGNAAEPAIVNNTKIWFRGRVNLDAVLHALNDEGFVGLS